MNPVLSVIMPSLNVADYIEPSVKSVMLQSFGDIEIICVDAGSTDGTLKKLQELAEKDSRIHIRLSDRKSYGYQVNMGVKAARGNYVGIVETDDTISPEMYETLYKAIEQSEVDFVKSDFFGATGAEDSKLEHYPVLSDAELYGCTIRFDDHPEILPMGMLATWSGLYRKSFLLKNDIWHNETPGASYQDVGFALQTYMLSSKILFLKQCFYHYRMDNAFSSVYAKNKVYCICDEFEFVRRRIVEEEKLQRFKGLFCYFFYKKYKRNLERISLENREAFLHRFQEDFQKLVIAGWIDRTIWKRNELYDLDDILCLGREYLKEIKKRRKAFFEKLHPSMGIIIYGAGVYGKRVFKEIEGNRNVLFFAVTEKKENNKNEAVCGIPMKTIEELSKTKKDAAVIVAVQDEKNKQEMVLYANKLGFLNIEAIPYGLFDYD